MTTLTDSHLLHHALRGGLSTDAPGAPGRLTRRLGTSLLMAASLSAVFGVGLGSYSLALPQLVASAVKMPLLLIGTSLLCFPLFFLIQLSRAKTPLSLLEAAVLQSTALVATASVWAALSPPLLFLVVTSEQYGLARVLAVLVGAAGGVVGLRRFGRLYAAAVGEEDARGMRWLLRAFFAVYGLVGLQLAWTIRPFIGSPFRPFELIRSFEGGIFGLL